MRKIIGIGESILDIIFRNQQPSHAVPGGSTFNTLISLGRLGIPATFISEIGHDTVGDMILDFMQKNHVATENLDIFCEGKTPISLAFLDEKNEAHYMFYNQFPQDRLNFVWPRIDQDDIIIFGSYFALNPALRDKVREFVEFAKERKALWFGWLERHGAKTMLLSWLPGIGDPLCTLGGWLKLPFWPCVIYMAIGKLGRYIVMTWLLLYIPDSSWRGLAQFLG